MLERSFVRKKGLLFIPMIGKLRYGRYVDGIINLAQVMEEQNLLLH